MGIRNFLRSITPGDDQQLAADLAREQRVRRSRSATRAARKGQKWEDTDRQREKRGIWRPNP
ncbi:hypothetical protein [Streptomyces acidiscabies]|uniref:Uncharacterized protein n=1 Tax=Streptomyces acidiscabies TaxID=42234 RepID=A0ABU4LVW0_9ACTN|nr:hypothetical protein [Streptomyces acidiscabies]MDX3019880.1 hypothetical protein [Streptomyces acidiscabies]GAQ52083.1 hypothetical protein a10_01864 [Streptomyces acidiscabies]